MRDDQGTYEDEHHMIDAESRNIMINEVRILYEIKGLSKLCFLAIMEGKQLEGNAAVKHEYALHRLLKLLGIEIVVHDEPEEKKPTILVPRQEN